MSNGRLESPNLDDRTWQDIVNEARALIPKYAPEWTDHNPSDLGITLIELFAWIVEGMIYRLNRVPEKNYIEFLNLLGITRDPAVPASTFLTYGLAPGTAPETTSAIVPKGSLAATQQTETEEGIVFETDKELKVLPINLTTALFISEAAGDTAYKYLYQNVTANLVSSPLSKMSAKISGSKSIIIALGFDSKTTQDISLLFGFDTPVKTDTEGVPIEITWLYSKNDAEPELTEASWPNIEAVSGGTNTFQKNGSVSLNVPVDWTNQNPGSWKSVSCYNKVDEINQSLFWIGVKIKNLRQKDLTLELQHILFNSVSATNAITIAQPELLGFSNGKSFQSFELKNRPLFKKPRTMNPYDHLVIQVRKPQVGGGFGEWETWALCDDFNRGAGNYFRLDPVTGKISFGNYDSTTSPEGYGTIPPVDSEIRAQTYRYVEGGVKGNVPPNTVNSMRTYVAGVISVTNPGASEGGFDEEDLEETKRRGPEILRNRYRAITVEDYEYLVKEATPAVKKVRCLPPRLFSQYDCLPSVKIGDPWTFGGLNRSTGNVNVIIVPDASLSDRAPMPSEELIQQVSDYLDERRTLTSKLLVTYPRYLPIHVTVTINIWQKAVDTGLTPDPRKSDQLKDEIKEKIQKFLHPVLGGPEGNGWEVGQDITISTLFDYIEPGSDIGFISDLSINAQTPLYIPPTRPTFDQSAISNVWVKLADYEIICSDQDHYVKVNQVSTKELKLP
jgi:uncharacterized phage protein gp47/JayE